MSKSQEKHSTVFLHNPTEGGPRQNRLTFQKLKTLGSPSAREAR